jgi:hypothetical protein
MKTFFLFIATEITLSSACFAQRYKLEHVSIAFTNTHTAVPFGSFSKLFVKEVHPGFELGTGFNWSRKEEKNHDWFQTFQFGYSYHQWVQHSIVLYTQFGYRYKFPKGFSLETKLGGGYMRAIVANQVFSDGQDSERQYAKITSGRSQSILNLAFKASKKIGSKRPGKVFLEYEQRLQSPFIHDYVPLLPYNGMKVGFQIPIHK